MHQEIWLTEMAPRVSDAHRKATMYGSGFVTLLQRRVVYDTTTSTLRLQTWRNHFLSLFNTYRKYGFYGLRKSISNTEYKI